MENKGWAEEQQRNTSETISECKGRENFRQSDLSTQLPQPLKSDVYSWGRQETVIES